MRALDIFMRRRRSWLVIGIILICVGCFYLTAEYKKSRIDYFIVIPLTDHSNSTNQVNYYETEHTVRICGIGDLVYEEYCVFAPYEETRKSDAAITLCTQGTVEFLHHVTVLCHRWGGPISVAVYSPVEDYVESRREVDLLRKCDFCIRYWVSWYFFFHKQQMPEFSESELPAGDCKSIMQERQPKKRRSSGTYPINVGRNIARQRAHSPFVFSIDIELYPSLRILPKFERMLRLQHPTSAHQVWVVPVFEVHSKYKAPFTMTELKSMYLRKEVISFHKYRCDICHKIPNLTNWINLQDAFSSEVDESLEPLRVFTTVKRNKYYRLNSWEPFFIGTTQDPEFDIRLSWEGKQNKMQMAYEMCMRDYDFHIIENAFLAHAPGINVYNSTKEKDRRKYTKQNSKVILSVRRNLKLKYGSRKDC